MSPRLLLSCATQLALVLLPLGEAAQGPLRFGDPASAQDAAPFFANSTYDPGVPSPVAILGREIGSRPAHHGEILSALRAIAEASPRALYEPFGSTHEGRELGLFIVSSPENMQRLEEIRADLTRLADPRGLDTESARAIVTRTPPLAWMAYSIHGDETSGSDAALALAWHLAAGISVDVTELLQRVVVVIDPCMNPDGRERILTMIEQSAGRVGNPDPSGMHRGRWPWGRGNHYLFDMNRDWLSGTQPETRARWRAVLAHRPQLFVDAHEMSGLDTFLFSPPRAPLNRQLPASNEHWWQEFAREQAAAFDEFGWSYYTREWFESWYPGYSDAWGSLNGAIGILYEQASYRGQPLRRLSGEIETYRDAVKRQLVSSVTNLGTLARNAKLVLEEFSARRRANVAAETEGNDRMLCIPPDGRTDRRAFLLRALLGQGIEVSVAQEAFSARSAKSSLHEAADELAFPAGTLIVPARQPQGPLVKTYFDFDPRLSPEELADERRELVTKRQTKIYDVTAWSLPHALDIKAWWVTAREVDARPLVTLDESPGRVVPSADDGSAVYGWVVDGRRDRSLAFAAAAMERGLAVNVSDREFRAAGQAFTRGSFLVRGHENSPTAAAHVADAALTSGVTAFAVHGGRSADEGPDLGGGHFQLLERPRVALLSNAPVSTSDCGHAWHALDVDLELPVTMLDAASFSEFDLRKFNVLVLPGGSEATLAEQAASIADWVKDGGTLIAFGSAAAEATNEAHGLSTVRRRRDVLGELNVYAWAVENERRARELEVDEEALLGTPATDDAPAPTEGSAASEDDALLTRKDDWARLFSPEGVFLRGEVDQWSWLTMGCDEELPVMFTGSSVYLAEHPVRVAVRIAPPDRARLAGLLWPEARDRVGDSAYATVESVGHGQVILFAASPVFRGWHLGVQRLFANAVVCGPGLGTQPVRAR